MPNKHQENQINLLCAAIMLGAEKQLFDAVSLKNKYFDLKKDKNRRGNQTSFYRQLSILVEKGLIVEERRAKSSKPRAYKKGIGQPPNFYRLSHKVIQQGIIQYQLILNEYKQMAVQAIKDDEKQKHLEFITEKSRQMAELFITEASILDVILLDGKPSPLRQCDTLTGTILSSGKIPFISNITVWCEQKFIDNTMVNNTAKYLQSLTTQESLTSLFQKAFEKAGVEQASFYVISKYEYRKNCYIKFLPSPSHLRP